MLWRVPCQAFGKAAQGRTRSKTFRAQEDRGGSRQRLECGGFSSAFGGMETGRGD
jgi:hypothetical protein